MSILRLLFSAALILAATFAHALTVRAPSFTELVAQADTIVRGEVISRRCEWRETPRGRAIVTFVKVRIETTLKGSPAGEIELRMLGGEIGSERMEIEGLPQFGAGDRDYLFIEGNGRMMCPLVGIPHGRYPVVRAEASGLDFVARADGTPLTTVEEVSHPLAESTARPVLEQMRQAPMRGADFETAIRTELKRQAAATIR